jgi:hypothetical protein
MLDCYTMHTFDLRFGPAITPEQRVGYEELYPMFVAVRDQIFNEAGVKETSPPKATKADRFQGRHLDHLEGKMIKLGATPRPE